MALKSKEPVKGELQRKVLSAEIQVQPPSEDDPKTQGGRN